MIVILILHCKLQINIHNYKCQKWKDDRQEVITEYYLQYLGDKDENTSYSGSENDQNSKESENSSEKEDEEELNGENFSYQKADKQSSEKAGLSYFNQQESGQFQGKQLFSNPEVIKEDYDNENEMPSLNKINESQNLKSNDSFNLSMQKSKEYINLSQKQIELEMNHPQKAAIDANNKIQIPETKDKKNINSFQEIHKIHGYDQLQNNHHSQYLEKSNINLDCDVVETTEESIKYQNFTHKIYYKGNTSQPIEELIDPYGQGSKISNEKVQNSSFPEEDQEQLTKNHNLILDNYSQKDIKALQIDGLNSNPEFKKTDINSISQPHTLKQNQEISEPQIYKVEKEVCNFQPKIDKAEKEVCSSSPRIYKVEKEIRNSSPNNNMISKRGSASFENEMNNSIIKQQTNKLILTKQVPSELSSLKTSNKIKNKTGTKKNIDISPVDFKDITNKKIHTFDQLGQIQFSLDQLRNDEVQGKRNEQLKSMYEENQIRPTIKSQHYYSNEIKQQSDQSFQQNEINSPSIYIACKPPLVQISSSSLSPNKITDEYKMNISSLKEFQQNFDQSNPMYNVNQQSLREFPEIHQQKRSLTSSTKRHSQYKQRKTNNSVIIPAGSSKQINCSIGSPLVYNTKDNKSNNLFQGDSIAQNILSNQLFIDLNNQGNMLKQNDMSQSLNNSPIRIPKQGNITPYPLDSENSQNLDYITSRLSKESSPGRRMQEKSPLNFNTHELIKRGKNSSFSQLSEGIGDRLAQINFSRRNIMKMEDITGRHLSWKVPKQDSTSPAIIQNYQFGQQVNNKQPAIHNESINMDQIQLLNKQKSNETDLNQQQQRQQIQNISFPWNIDVQQVYQNQIQQQIQQLLGMHQDHGNQHGVTYRSNFENNNPSYLESKLFLLMEFDCMKTFRSYYPNYNSQQIIQKANSCLINNLMLPGKRLKRPKNQTSKRLARTEDAFLNTNRRINTLVSKKTPIIKSQRSNDKQSQNVQSSFVSENQKLLINLRNSPSLPCSKINESQFSNESSRINKKLDSISEIDFTSIIKEDNRIQL